MCEWGGGEGKGFRHQNMRWTCQFSSWISTRLTKANLSGVSESCYTYLVFGESADNQTVVSILSEVQRTGGGY